MRILVIIFVLFSGYFAFSAPAKKKIAILNFTATDENKAYANIIRNKIEFNFHKTARYELLERSKINYLVDDFKLSSSQNKNLKKEIKIGKLLTADFVISGSIEYSNLYIVTIRIIDVKSGKLVAINTNEFKDKKTLIAGTKQVSSQSIKSVDDVDVKRIASKEKKTRMEMSIGYLNPVKKMKDNVKNGLFATVSYGKENYIFRNLFLGVKCGFYNLKSNNDSVSQASMVPIMFSIDYSLTIYHPLKIIPSLNAGTSYNRFANDAFEPVLEGGASLSYDITLLTSIKLNYFYGTIYEKEGTLHYHNYSLGLAIYY